jgi:PAS domain-containing protein
MMISKTRFINDIRCNRYAALDELRHKQDKAFVSFSESDTIDDLISLENQARKQTLLDDMIDDEGIDLLEHKDEQLDVMLPYYREIEMIVGRAIRNRFEGDVVYSLDTRSQKRFEYEEDGYRFFCFLDGYQEDDASIRIFEVKATTSRKFFDLVYKKDTKDKESVFAYDDKGIARLRQDLGEKVNRDYHTKVQKLRKRLGREGRYVHDLLYQRHVIEHALETDKTISYHLVVLNADHIHDGRTEGGMKPVYPDDLVVFFDLTSLTKDLMPVIAHDVKTVIGRLDRMDAGPVPLGPHCQRNDIRQCVFQPICFKDVPEHNSIFVYLHGHHGFKDERGVRHERFDLVNDGMVRATDIPRSWLQRPDNVIQRDVIDSGVPFYRKDKIRAGIRTLSYPLYHLDFESFPCPLPRFKGEKPYSQSVFQFSVHIEHAPGVCDKVKDNVNFLADSHKDLRRPLVEAMLDVIKDDGGSVVVYNKAFEQTRIIEFAELFPEHRDRLLSIKDRLFDLMHLVRGNARFYEALGYDPDDAKGINVYHTDLDGSYSIKRVLPLFTSLSYGDLGIGNGTQAMVAYARFPEMDKETLDKTRKELLEYCAQDTWAMVEILSALRRICV